jgi:Rrf2 family iron-sulfur cluster assembly transcriptional regulator
MTHDLWSSLNDRILDYLSGVSLADLVASQGDGKKIVFSNRTDSLKTDSQESSHQAQPQKQLATV